MTHYDQSNNDNNDRNIFYESYNTCSSEQHTLLES